MSCGAKLKILQVLKTTTIRIFEKEAVGDGLLAVKGCVGVGGLPPF